MLQMKKIYKTLLKKKFITIKRNNDKLQIFLKQKNTKVKSGGSAMAQLTEIGKLDKEVYENNARITEYLISLGKLYDIIVNKTDNITSGEITKMSKQLGLKKETIIALNKKVIELESKVKENKKSSLQDKALIFELSKKQNKQKEDLNEIIDDLIKNKEVVVNLRNVKENLQEKILDIEIKNTELEKKILDMKLLETNLTTLETERDELKKEYTTYKKYHSNWRKMKKGSLVRITSDLLSGRKTGEIGEIVKIDKKNKRIYVSWVNKKNNKKNQNIFQWIIESTLENKMELVCDPKKICI